MPARRFHCALLVGAALIAAWPIVGATADAETAAGISAMTAFTPLVSQVLTTPQPVKASDGQYHIAYELLLTNAIGIPVELTEIEIRDAKTGRILLALGGLELKQQINSISHVAADASGDPTIATSSTTIVWLDVVVPSVESIPDEIDHRVVGNAVTPKGAMAFESILSVLTLNKAEPIVLGPPVPSGKWLIARDAAAITRIITMGSLPSMDA